MSRGALCVYAVASCGIAQFCLHSELPWEIRDQEAVSISCQRRIIGIRRYHFATNASVCGQLNELGKSVRLYLQWSFICLWSRSSAQLSIDALALSPLCLAIGIRFGRTPDGGCMETLTWTTTAHTDSPAGEEQRAHCSLPMMHGL